jgi:hypothetical protein
MHQGPLAPSHSRNASVSTQLSTSHRSLWAVRRSGSASRDPRAFRTAIACGQIEEKLAAWRAEAVAPQMQPSRYRPVPLAACDGVASAGAVAGLSHQNPAAKRLGQNNWHVATRFDLDQVDCTRTQPAGDAIIGIIPERPAQLRRKSG